MKALSVTLTISLIAILFPLIAIGSDPSLVLYMPFEEGAGTTTKDMSGNGNDGKLVGGVKWTTGKYGNALEFNGTDSRVEIQSNNTLQPYDSGFSIEAWIKADPGSSQWARVVDKFYGTGYCFGRRGGDLVIGTEFGGNPNSFASKATVFDNEWHHVTLTREVKAGGGELKIYVDGKMENTIVAPNANVHNLDTTPVRIGAGDECCVEGPPDNVAYFFKGIIDEVAIYKKTLTEEEVNRNMGGMTAVEPSGKLSTTWASIKNR